MTLENDKVGVYLIFPTTIYTARLNDYKKFNKTILDNIDPYNFETFDSSVPDGYRMTGEHIGKINMHHNPLFEEFFKVISEHAKTYVSVLGMRDEVFDYYITKTWLSIIDKPGQHMNYHIHSNSEISFIYYLEVPENPDCISFKNKNRPNELFSGMMDDTRPEKHHTFFKERNDSNFNSFFIPPQEGLLVMWPGNLPHGTVQNPHFKELQKGRRCGISGDFNLVIKPGYDFFEAGRINLEHMRKFN